MKFFIVLFLSFSVTIFSQEEEFVEKYSIINFDVLDIASHHFTITISSKDGEELCHLLKGTSHKNLKLFMGERGTEIFKSSVRKRNDDNTYEAIISSYDKIAPGIKNKISLYIIENNRKKLEDDYDFSYFGNNKPNEQPIIEKLKPSGGAADDTIKIIGRNFGNDIDKIVIHLYDIQSEHIPEYDDDGNAFRLNQSNFKFSECDYSIPDNDNTPFDYRRDMGTVVPLSLVNAENGLQEVRFAIPSDLRSKANENLLRSKIKMRMYVNGRPTDLRTITILHDNWSYKILSFTIFMSVLGWIFIAFVLKRIDFFTYILLDRTTNSYSLSKLQALLWTMVLIASYFYVAISSGLILRSGEMPDFNPSLLGLMGISYSGLLSASFIGRKNPNNSNKDKPPSITDLITTNSEVDMGKLQLLVFTLVTVVVYIYNLYQSNILNGLPDIPPSLHGLLFTSQTGYITGKLLKNKIAINKISPKKIQVTNSMKSFELKIIGNGFQPGLKIMLEDSDSRPVDANIESSTNLYCELPFDTTLGKKNLIIIPPEGSSITIDNAVELIQKEDDIMNEDEILEMEKEFYKNAAKENEEDVKPSKKTKKKKDVG
jgi:hypothetical protein